MPKELLYPSTKRTRNELRALYMNNVYNLFLTSHEWTGLTYQQENYLMRKLWSEEGRVALFPLKHFENEPIESDRFILTTFAETSFNVNDYPAEVNLINVRGARFIPNRPVKVDKECVICYAQPSKKGLIGFVQVYINKIVDCEMLIKLSMNAQKVPFMIKTSEENKRMIEEIYNSLASDNPKIFVPEDYNGNLGVLLTGAPYIIDKLYNYKNALWNELLTYLGINNLGVNEKKEHLITSEVDSNNDYIEKSGDCITIQLKGFCERANKLFGYHLSVESKSCFKQAKTSQETEDEENDEIE